VLLVTRVAGVESLPVGPFVSLAWLGINCAGKADVIRWALLILGSYQSGQMGLTVNQLSTTSGVRIPHCPPKTCPCGAAVAHSLGKTGVMGSIPITGSRGF